MTTATIDHRLLICSLCERTFASPKLLPCLHVFCEPCIENYVKEAKEKRKSQEQHVLGLTVLPERNELSPKPIVTVKQPSIAKQQSVESKGDSNSDRSRASTLDAQIPPQSYDDIPPHDASAEFHRRGADKDLHDGGIYEEISARAPCTGSSPLLRGSLAKGVRSGSAPVIRESFGPQYVAMNKSQSAIDNGDLVVAALAGSFSDTSSAALSSSREVLNVPLNSSSERSDSQIYVPPSTDHSFPDVIPQVGPNSSLNATEVQSEVTVNLQRNNTICGKATLMPGFVDNIGARRNSKEKILEGEEEISMSKQPSMLSVVSRASSSSGCSPGEDTPTAAVVSTTRLPKKSKDKSKQKTAKRVKKEQKRKHKVVPPMMKPLSQPKPMQAIPEPPAECYHADVSHEDDYLYEMPVNMTGSGPPALPPRMESSPALPSHRVVPNLYIDSNTMRRSDDRVLDKEHRVNLTQNNSEIQDEDHYDYVESPSSQYCPSKKVAAALIRDKASHYGPTLRKSQILIDPEGYEYISDAFQKVKIKTELGESEFLYKEIHQLEEMVEKNTNRPRSDSQPSTSSVDSLRENEYECPQCSSVFKFEKGVQNFQSAKFIGSLQDIHFKQCLKPKTCSDCDSRNVTSECPLCHVMLCENCVVNHKCSSVALQPSEQVYSNVRPRCANHTYNVCEYYCHTCSVQICNDCFVTSHRHHACALIEVVKFRTVEYLGDFQEFLGEIKKVYENEILQMDKYMRQYECEKEKVLSDITYAYVRARELMEEGYCELSRHVNFRYEEEINYAKDLQAANKRFVERIDHACCFAKHLATHGNQIDGIEMSRALSENLLDLQSHDPIRLESKLHVQFSPSTSKPIDFIPLIGNACRAYNAVRRKSMFPEDGMSRREMLLHAKNPFIEVGLFKPRTEGDARGCKPTGVTMSKTGEIVIVDDINRKIKVFSQKGVLTHEVNPKGESSLIDPWDIAMTHYGNFVVTDKGSKSVKIFDTDGEIVSEFGKHLANPWGVCTNSGGDLIVTDTTHKSVFVHDSIGNLKYQVNGPDGLLVFPEYVTSNVNDDVIVSDFKGNCIHVFSSVGQFLFRIKASTPNGKLFESPCGVACDQQGNILLADFENARVCEFTCGGQFVSYILTKSDHIRGPQCLTSNRKVAKQTPRLVLVDGTEIKIYRRKNTVRISQIFDDENLDDLELKPKSYTKGKNSEQVPSAPRPRRKLLPLDIPASKMESKLLTSDSSDVQTLRSGQSLQRATEQQQQHIERSYSVLSSPDTYDVPNTPPLPIKNGASAETHDPFTPSKLSSLKAGLPEEQKTEFPIPKPRHIRNKDRSSELAATQNTYVLPEASVTNLLYADADEFTNPQLVYAKDQKPVDGEKSLPVIDQKDSREKLRKCDSKSDVSSATPALLQEGYRMSSVNRSTRNKPLIDKLIKQLGLEDGSQSDEASHSSSDTPSEKSKRWRSKSAASKALQIPEKFKEKAGDKLNKRRSASLTRNRVRVSVRPQLNASFPSDTSEAHALSVESLQKEKKTVQCGGQRANCSRVKSCETLAESGAKITPV